ncbi:hypothetical protein AB0M28_13335 [Streptomyces sp. NPDC051940]|uniref:hypothetical protein n=1 Tax=Streptomyces sp. NPDC051940 TaxID=3155675 RepID=UPI003434F57E
MSEYVPLHWLPDVGGVQGDENLRLLEWAQRTREERLGQAAAEPDDGPDDEREDGPQAGDKCIYCGTDKDLTVIGHATVNQTRGPGLEVPYYGCAECIPSPPADAARGHGCAR